MDAVIKAAVKDEQERQAAQQSPRTQQQAQVQAVQPCYYLLISKYYIF